MPTGDTMAISDRMPEIVVEYIVNDKWKRKKFSSVRKARAFYNKQEKRGATPRLRKPTAADD